MNLLLQLLPFLALTLILAASISVYIWRKGRRKRSSSISHLAPAAPSVVPAASPIPSNRESSSPISPGPAQILCLHTMGITPARIATALGSSLQEVEIVLRVSAIRQSRLATTAQLS